MSFPDWLRELTEPWDDPGKGNWDNAFVLGLANLAAQDHEALESALGDMPLATTQREDVLAAIKAGEDFKKQYE